jgi:uncharacterized protein (DUF1697 family)
MTTYVALLRGINLGGHNRVPMADLRAVYERAGYGDVRTYVQSGNVLFTSDREDVDAMARELTEVVEAQLGVLATTMVRTAEELGAVADANPYAVEAAADPTKVHAAFLGTQHADPHALMSGMERHAPEELTAGDRVLYLHLPRGIGRSKLAADLARRSVDMTIRNWRTVTKLLELTR